MPPIIIPLAATLVIYTGISIPLAVAIATVVVVGSIGMAIFNLASALTADFDAPDTGQGLLINKASSSEPLKVIYGYRRVGIVRVFAESDGKNNKFMHLILALAEGEIESIENVYFHDKLSTDEQFTGKFELYKHLGSDTQAADATLVERLVSWTTAHKLSGVAYLYLRLEYDRTAWASGLPPITADIKGLKVYDPRTTTTAWSDNPVLCVRDYMTNARYGRGIPESQIDDASFIVAANYCDEMVTKGGSSQKRYTLNGVINVEKTPMSIVRNMMTSCRGILIFSGGKYKVVIDKPETASFVFNEDNIVGNWSISLGDKTNTFNRIKAKIYNKDRSWQDDYITVDSPDLRALDNGLMLQQDAQLPFTSDEVTARQITTINLNQSRQQISVQFSATIQGMRAEVGDVVYITHSTTGWSNKKFRITAIAMSNADDVSIVALEYDETIYDFGTIPLIDATPNTNFYNPSVVIQPSDLTLSEELYYTSSSSGVHSRLILRWVNNDGFALQYNIEYKLSADTDYIPLAVAQSSEYRIDDVAAGVYDVRVRTMNDSGATSDWTYDSFGVVGLTEKPADITGFNIRAMDGSVYLVWDAVTDIDVIHGGYVRVRHSALVSNATWDDGIDIGTRISGNITNTVLPLRAGTYMMKAVDSSGNFSNGYAASVTTVKNIHVFSNAVSTLESATFSGAKTNLIVVGSVMRLATLSASNTGTYLFQNSLDLGGVFTSRLFAEFESSSYTSGDNFDSRDTLIDTWRNFDGEQSDLIDATVQVRTTNDDPTGSPTWSEWIELTSADFKARAYEGRVLVESTTADFNIDITYLKVTVDMPDRVERGTSINSTTSGIAVTYTEPFFTTPTVGITANSHNGNFVISSSTGTGFTVNFYDGSGTSTPQNINFNYQAIGY